MDSINRNKLNSLLKAWPANTVAVSSWLRDMGISTQLLVSYIKSNWVKSIGHGAFIKSGDTIKWTGALYAIQQQMNLPIHVGGISALELQGYGQYASLGQQKIHLFGMNQIRVPTWFKKYPWDIDILYYNSNFLPIQNDLVLFSIDNIKIMTSTPERAILEALYLVPRYQSLEECDYIMEGLLNLRPDLLQTLLEDCKSIKVKRLFLFLAERANHSWFKHLHSDRINLGFGERQIIKGGYFDQKYLITVSQSLKPDSLSTI